MINAIATDVRARVARLARDVADAQSRRADAARVRRELSAYTDRELNDIGVRRGDIAALAKEATAR